MKAKTLTPYRLIFLMLLFLNCVLNMEAQTINIFLKSCSVTKTTLDFDIYIENGTNTKASDFILQSGAYGIDINGDEISNGGTLTVDYLKGTNEFNEAMINFTPKNCSYNSTSHSIRINAQIVTNIANGTSMKPGKQMRVGTFRISNTVNWKPNSKAKFQWVTGLAANKTQTKFTLYLNGSSMASKCIPKEENFKIDTSCKLIVLNAEGQ